MDEVVQGGGALVIIHLCKKCPIQRRVVPVSQRSATAPCPPKVFHITLCPLPPHPHAAISLPTTHEPSGPGHRVQLSAPSAVAECRCQTFDSIEYTRGCPGRACWWDRGTRPLAFWGLTGTFKGNAYLSLRERETGGRGRKGEGGVYLSCTPTLALRRCHGRAWGKKQRSV